MAHFWIVQQSYDEYFEALKVNVFYKNNTLSLESMKLTTRRSSCNFIFLGAF